MLSSRRAPTSSQPAGGCSGSSGTSTPRAIRRSGSRVSGPPCAAERELTRISRPKGTRLWKGEPHSVAAAPEIRPVQSHQEFLGALRVRVKVFVEEQGGPPEDEPDGWDAAARQFVVLVGEEVVGTA